MYISVWVLAPRYQDLDGPAGSALWRAIAENKQRWSLDGWPKNYYFEFLRASERTLSRWSRLSLAPTKPQVVGYVRSPYV
jgi:hypothetical protein